MTDKQRCYKLYADEFGDDEFAVKLFDTCYEFCEKYRIDNEIVAIMFLLPCKIIIDSSEYSAKYIFAVTTDKKYRGNGYMSSFLEKIKKEEEIQFLCPSNESLINFYKKQDFIPFNAYKRKAGERSVILCDGFLSLAKDFAELNGEKYTAMYRYKEKINLNSLNFPYTME